MNDLDTRLRETMEQVADSTRVRRRVDEIVRVRRHRSTPSLVVGMASFAAVLVVFALPMILIGEPGGEVGVGSQESPDSGVTPISPQVVVVDPEWLTVEPEDVAAFEDMALPGDGERAPLRTESIWCFYEDSRPIETSVTGVAVDEPVTTESLITSCTGHPEVATEGSEPTEAGTVCRGVIADSAYEEFVAAGEWDMTPEDITHSRPGFPVILTWASECVSESLESHPPITLTADLNLDSVNKARQLELAARGASLQQCLTNDQAAALTDAIVEELGDNWMSEPRPVGANPASGEQAAAYCYQPFIDQQWGFVFYADISEAPDPQTTASTLPPITTQPEG